MNNKFKRILRIAAPVFFCFVLVFTLAAPACAAGNALNYRDYEQFVTVDGENDIVYVEFPLEYCRTVIYDSSGNGLEAFIGGSGSKPLYSGTYSIIFWPFGNQDWTFDDTSDFFGYALDLSNIPSDTQFSFDVIFQGVSAGGLTLATGTWRQFYLNSDWKSAVVSTHTGVNGTNSESWISSLHFTYLGYLDKTSSSHSYWFPAFRVNDFVISDNAGINYSVSSFKMQMSISSLYRLQEETGRTNEILSEVERQLGEQNDLLDDAIFGTVPDSKLPTNSGIIDDYENKENELWDSVSGGLDDANNSFSNSSAYVANLTGTFAFVAAMCNDLWLIEPFGSLLHVSLSLGVTASILGLGYLAARSSSRSGSAGRRKKGGG